MLDFHLIGQKLEKMAVYLNEVEISNDRDLNLINRLLPNAESNRLKLLEILDNWSKQFLFTAARPLDPISTQIPLLEPLERYTIFASDTSVISPNHHEISYCYLINLGRAMIHYHQSLHPLLDSDPQVFTPDRARILMRDWKMPILEAISHYRTIEKSTSVARLALKWVRPPGSHYNTPNLALLSGSLVPWFDNKLSIDIKRKILAPINEARSQLQKHGIPLIGYVSRSSSREVLNFLRLSACVYDYPECEKNCGHLELQLEQPPCQISNSLKDKLFWGNLLAPGLRSGIWKINSDVAALFEESQKVYFCYANVGYEIVRLEFPAWVLEDSQLFDRALAITISQVKKGFGYPIALTEAYHQASIRADDRAYFYGLLEKALLKSGINNVATSYKEARKRISVA